MSPTVLIGLALAGAASVALNGSFLIQHVGSQSVPEIAVRRPIAAVRSLFASRLWLVGAALGMTGWALHVGALSSAPLSLVQAFAAGGLALTVPAASRFLGVRLLPRERTAVLLMGAALLALAIGARAKPGALEVPTLIALCLGAGGLAAVFAAGASRHRRTVLLGAAAGTLYGAADAATKAATLAAGAGHWAAGSAWLVAILALSAGAFLCFQRGLQQAPVVQVIALMTVMTTAASVLCGLVAFGDPLGATPALVALHALAFAVIGAGAWVLGGGQARLAERGEAAGRARRAALAPVGLGPTPGGSSA